MEEDGMKMLRNAHERERNLNKEIKDLKDKFSKKEDKVNELEKANEELKSKFKWGRQGICSTGGSVRVIISLIIFLYYVTRPVSFRSRNLSYLPLL